ncbi:MAG: EamA family transporter [Actinomycetota bacterium]
MKAAIWPLVAFVGVNLLTEPWKGEIDGLGILFAAISAAGWGAYIIFTQRVGDRFSGIKGLAITTPIAALTASLVGVPQAIGQITPQVMLIALGLALLIPVIPFALEMLALKRMKSGPFGTLMSIEPAIALLIGLVVLSQHPSGFQFFGIVLVVVAGVAASKPSERQHKPGH